MTDLAQSTTFRAVLKVYLTTDHISDATGKTVAVTISKNGAAFGNPSAGSVNATEIGNGWYYVDLSTTDTGTLGPLIVRGTATACDNSEAHHDIIAATNGRLTALPAVAAESAGGLFTRGTGAGQINQAANGQIDANVKTWIGGTIPAVNVTGVPIVDNKYLLGTIYSTPATAGIMDVNLKNIANAIVDATTAQIGTNIVNIKGTGSVGTAGYMGLDWAHITAPTTTVVLSGTTIGTITTYTGNTPQTGDAFIRLGTPAGASVSADIAAIKTDTAAIKTKTDFLPSATAGSAGGLFISGSNAATTVNITGNITGNLSGSVGSVMGLTASDVGTIKTNLGSPAGASIAADIAALPSAQTNADTLLNRDMSAVTDTNSRTPLNALRFIRNKWGVSAGTLTVTKENDTTTAWTAAIATDAAAVPVVGSDPT